MSAEVIDLANMTGVALDDVTAVDVRWFDAHPLAVERYRSAFPVEVDVVAQPCPVLDHYRVNVRRLGSTRESHAKLLLHSDHDTGRRAVALLGVALYPAGALDELVRR